MKISESNSIKRLEAVQGTDAGLFVLAVHSFAEAWMRKELGLTSDGFRDLTFSDLTFQFGNYLQDKWNDRFLKNYEVLRNLRQAHSATNLVRHNFAELETEASIIATQHLINFCQLAGIPTGRELLALQSVLKKWDEKKPYSTLEMENRELLKSLEQISLENQKLSKEVLESRKLQEEKEHLTYRLKQTENELLKAEKSNEKKTDRIENLRKERGNYKNEISNKNKEIKALRESESKLQKFQHSLVYARTRLDYERMIVQLTNEQKKVLSQIGLKSDFLIKGSAGTGKTLVLLKAIEKAKGYSLDSENAQNELDMPELSGNIAFLTYTNTLVKYGKWLSELMLKNILTSEDRICTVDSFIIDELKKIKPSLEISYDYEQLNNLTKEFFEQLKEKDFFNNLPKDFSEFDLFDEAELFIWANGIKENEYVDNVIIRHGRKNPISSEMRKPVWDAIDSFKDFLIEKNIVTRSLGANIIVEKSESKDSVVEPSIDYLFIDEVQDLSAIILKACRALTKKSLILAGDSDQSIYQTGFSFKKAGIDITGRSRILRANFRNTKTIHELAEKYRTNKTSDLETKSFAWREGPYPVLIQTSCKDELKQELLERVKFFIEILEYEPHNLCILAPYNSDLESISELLSAHDFANIKMRDSDFDFNSMGNIRLTTMHSAKGLDFPVVLLYLHSVHIDYKSSDLDSQNIKAKNLIYVSLTRAMEHLDIFSLDNTELSPIQDLITIIKDQE